MSTSMARRGPTAPGVVPAAMAVVWTLIVLVGFVVLPFYRSSSTSISTDGTTTSSVSEETIFEHEGMGVLAVLLVPVVVAFVGMVGAAFRIRAATLGAAGMAAGLCLLGMASIGMFYLPAAVLLVIAAVRSRAVPGGDARNGGSRGRSAALGACLAWTFLAAAIAAMRFQQVNDDARLIVGIASLVGVGAAVAAAYLVWAGRPRLAGAALIVSALTPTYGLWVLNVPALCLGAGLAATGRAPDPIKVNG